MIFFSGKGGLSGDIWLATMLAAIGDERPIEKVEENLPWMSAHLEMSQKDREIEARIHIKGAEQSPRQNWRDMSNFVVNTNFETPVKKRALKVLYNRQLNEAKGIGFPLEKMIYSGKEVGDTLFDILAGTYFWHLLGEPVVGLSGYLDIGYFPPPATKKLLKDIPNKTPRQERELTTPTSAALLRETYQEIDEPGREPDLIVVSGGKYAYQGRVEKTVSHHYF